MAQGTGRSEERTDFLGNKYTIHYDGDGNEIGRSEHRDAALFDVEHIQHYDSHGNEIGRSEYRDATLFYGEHIQHYDSDLKKTGRSEHRDATLFDGEHIQHSGPHPFLTQRPVVPNNVDPDDYTSPFDFDEQEASPSEDDIWGTLIMWFIGLSVVLSIILAIIYLGILVIAYFGATLIISFDFVASSFSWLGIQSPPVAWFLLGFLIGGGIGLIKGLIKLEQPQALPKVYWVGAGFGVLILIGSVSALFTAEPKLPLQTEIGKEAVSAMSFPQKSPPLTPNQIVITPTSETTQDWSDKSTSELEARGSEVFTLLKEKSTETESDWAEVASIYQHLNQVKPNNLYLSRQYFAQARLAFLRNDFQSAITAYEQSIAHDTSWALPINGLGRVYVNLGDKKRGRDYYTQATQIEPQWIYPWINLGRVCLSLKDYSSAERAFRQALILNPHKALVHYELGQALEKLNRPCEAVRAYHLALSTSQSRARLEFNENQVRRQIENLKRQSGCVEEDL